MIKTFIFQEKNKGLKAFLYSLFFIFIYWNVMNQKDINDKSESAMKETETTNVPEVDDETF
jgi:hypothetical protein